MSYAYVRNGTVRREYATLPDTFDNVSYPAGLSETERNALGLYAVIDVAPTLSEFESANRALTFNAGQQTVTAVYEIEAFNLPKVRRLLRKKIEGLRDAALAGGCKVLIGAQDRWIPTTVESKVQIAGMVALGNNLPAGLRVKDLEDNLIAVNVARALTILTAIMNREATVFDHAEALLSAVNASGTPATVDVESGWPESYVAP